MFRCRLILASVMFFGMGSVWANTGRPPGPTRSSPPPSPTVSDQAKKILTSPSTQTAGSTSSSTQQADLQIQEARDLFSQGKYKEVLERLAKIAPGALSPTIREEFFKFWADAAEPEAKWLEAVLALLKARSEATVLERRKNYESKIESLIESKLSQAELDFVLQQYGEQYPRDPVDLRRVNILLSGGRREEARLLLTTVLHRTLAGSKYNSAAKNWLDRMTRLGDVSTRKVGLLLPLAGPSAGHGSAVVAGFRLALSSEIGAGLSDVTLVEADVGPNNESAVAAFDRLVFEDKVMAVVGPISGSQSEALALKSVEYGVPVITLSPRPGLIEKGPTVFRVALTPERQVRALVGYALQQLNATRFAILFPSDNFGREFANAYFEVVRELGGEITAAESYDPNQTDFKIPLENMIGTGVPIWRKSETDESIKQAETALARPLTPKEIQKLSYLKPMVDFDVLFLPDTFRALGQIIPSIMYADINRTQLLGPSTWNNTQLLSRAGQYLDGALFVDTFAPERKSKVTQSFVDLYQIKNGTLPSALSALGFDVGLAIKATFSKGQIKTHDDLRRALTALGSFDGSMGLHQWDERRDSLAELQLFGVKKGAFFHKNGILLKPRTTEF